MECYYSIHLDYPISDDQYLCVVVDVEKRLLLKELTLPVFIELQNIVCRKGYMVNSAYVHYNSGNSSRMILEEFLNFQLPQSPSGYLRNRFLSTRSRSAVKKVLQEEKVCDKDLAFVKSVLKL